MDIHLENINKYDEMDIVSKAKMIFISNALDKGWKIHKNGEHYIFSKKHGGKKEVFIGSYLKRFIEANLKSIK